MMRLAVISDTHVHDYQRFSIAGSRLRAVCHYIVWARQTAYERGVSVMVHLGDVFEAKDHIASRTWNAAVAAFQSFAPHLKTIFLAGNHDFSDAQRSECTIGTFDLFAQVVSRAPIVKEFDGLTTILVPYHPDFNAIEQFLGTKAKGCLVLGHFPVRGALQSRQHSSSEGVSPEALYRAGAAILGHFHLGRPPYLGPLVPLDFKCPNQRGRMAIVDTESLAIEIIENDAPRFISCSSVEARERLEEFGADFIVVEGRRDAQLEDRLRNRGAVVEFIPPVNPDLAPISPAGLDQLDIRAAAHQLAAASDLDTGRLMATWDEVWGLHVKAP